MKFQPSNAAVTSITGYSNAYYHENMYIPSASVLDLEANKHDTNEKKDNEYHNNDDDDDHLDGNGRVLRYETITMTSPVLSSARLHQRTRYITDNDVNELNDKLQSLLLNSTRNDEKDDDDEDEALMKRNCVMKSTKSTTKVSVVELNKKDQATTTYFGRCSLVIYNSMTNSFVEVVRSARLACTSS